MKLATYNVNGINGRLLAVLVRWLKEARPDIVCSAGTESHQRPVPASGH